MNGLQAPIGSRRPFLLVCLAVLCLFVTLWAIFYFRLGPFRPGRWYTYSAQLPGGRAILWRQRMVPHLLMRGVVTRIEVPDARGVEQRHDTIFPGDWWLPNAEFRMAPNGRDLWVVAEKRRLDKSEPAKHDIVAYLDLLTGSFVPGNVQGDIDLPDAQQSLRRSKAVDRWVLLHIEKPAVLLHWSNRFHGTTVRYGPRIQDEQMAVLIETSETCYRTAVDPVPLYSNVLLRSNAKSEAVCGYVDTERREFYDAQRFVWSYGTSHGQPIIRSAKPAARYPDVAREIADGWLTTPTWVIEPRPASSSP